MRISSPAFEHGGSIPSRFTCDGENCNPALQIDDIPDGTTSIALIMEDPDVPTHLREDGMWNHWVVWNMPPDTRKLEENAKAPGITGVNTGNRRDYQGPCPPDREHRYFFKVFALDAMLDLPPEATKEELLEAMRGHVIGQAELMGRYQRQ